MIYLNYYSHLLLQSKYKVIIYILFYILLIFLYNNNINYTYCLEENQNISTNKYLGMGLFLGSVALMLFIQGYGGGSDPATIIDMTMQLHGQGTLENTPEFLDYFTLTKKGTLYINALNIDTNNLYLNADEVIRQIQLEDNYQKILIDASQRLQNFYSQHNFPIDGMNNLEQLLPIHLNHFNEILGVSVQNNITLAYLANFVSSLESIGLLQPNYIQLLNQFITNGGMPDQFHNFLLSHIQNRP